MWKSDCHKQESAEWKEGNSQTHELIFFAQNQSVLDEKIRRKEHSKVLNSDGIPVFIAIQTNMNFHHTLSNTDARIHKPSHVVRLLNTYTHMDSSKSDCEMNQLQRSLVFAQDINSLELFL